MKNLIANYLRHRKIKKYIRTLGPFLKKRYGSNEYFTEDQIRSTLETLGLGGKYATYAYGLYAAPEELCGVLSKLNEVKSVREVRTFIASNYLGTSIGYTFSDVVATSEFSTGESSVSGTDASVGGDSGGGGSD